MNPRKLRDWKPCKWIHCISLWNPSLQQCCIASQRNENNIWCTSSRLVTSTGKNCMFRSSFVSFSLTEVHLRGNFSNESRWPSVFVTPERHELPMWKKQRLLIQISVIKLLWSVELLELCFCCVDIMRSTFCLRVFAGISASSREGYGNTDFAETCWLNGFKTTIPWSSPAVHLNWLVSLSCALLMVF